MTYSKRELEWKTNNYLPGNRYYPGDVVDVFLPGTEIVYYNITIRKENFLNNGKWNYTLLNPPFDLGPIHEIWIRPVRIIKDFSQGI